MEAYENIITRKSTRAFKSQPITKEVMQKIIEAASNSPSYTNTQPWNMMIVTGNKKDELGQILLNLSKENTLTSPDIPLPVGWPPQMEERSREHGARRLEMLGIERNDVQGREKINLMNLEFYGAPYVIFLFMDKSLGDWSLFDMGLFTQNLILSAHSLGVDSCIQAFVTKYACDIKKFLNVSQDQKLVICISMGYSDKKAKINKYRSIKKSFNEFVWWC